MQPSQFVVIIGSVAAKAIAKLYGANLHFHFTQMSDTQMFLEF